MAIEIPGLAADRLPHPEWGPGAALGRFTLAAGRLLAVLESAAAPAVVLDGLRALAASGASAQLMLAPDRGLVQVLLDGRRIPLTGAARDAVLKLLGESEAASAGPRVPSVSNVPDPFVAARVAAVDAQVRESRAHAADPQAGVVDPPEPVSASVVAAPLMNGADAAAAGTALARAVDGSGLFLEAHVAQWLRGERSLGQLQEEVRNLPLVAGDATAAASEHRANRQLDALQHQVINLDAHAWPGQPVQLEIARDPERRPDTAGADEPPGLFQATLSLQLPRVGMLRARIRLLHDTVGLQLDAEQTALVSPALHSLASALAARGLTLAALDLSAAGAPPAGQDPRP